MFSIINSSDLEIKKAACSLINDFAMKCLHEVNSNPNCVDPLIEFIDQCLENERISNVFISEDSDSLIWLFELSLCLVKDACCLLRDKILNLNSNLVLENRRKNYKSFELIITRIILILKKIKNQVTGNTPSTIALNDHSDKACHPTIYLEIMYSNQIYNVFTFLILFFTKFGREIAFLCDSSIIIETTLKIYKLFDFKIVSDLLISLLSGDVYLSILDFLTIYRVISSAICQKLSSVDEFSKLIDGFNSYLSRNSIDLPVRFFLNSLKSLTESAIQCDQLCDSILILFLRINSSEISFLALKQQLVLGVFNNLNSENRVNVASKLALSCIPYDSCFVLQLSYVFDSLKIRISESNHQLSTSDLCGFHFFVKIYEILPIDLPFQELSVILYKQLLSENESYMTAIVLSDLHKHIAFLEVDLLDDFLIRVSSLSDFPERWRYHRLLVRLFSSSPDILELKIQFFKSSLEGKYTEDLCFHVLDFLPFIIQKNSKIMEEVVSLLKERISIFTKVDFTRMACGLAGSLTSDGKCTYCDGHDGCYNLPVVDLLLFHEISEIYVKLAENKSNKLNILLSISRFLLHFDSVLSHMSAESLFSLLLDALEMCPLADSLKHKRFLGRLRQSIKWSTCYQMIVYSRSVILTSYEELPISTIIIFCEREETLFKTLNVIFNKFLSSKDSNLHILFHKIVLIKNIHFKAYLCEFYHVISRYISDSFFANSPNFSNIHSLFTEISSFLKIPLSISLVLKIAKRSLPSIFFTEMPRVSEFLHYVASFCCISRSRLIVDSIEKIYTVLVCQCQTGDEFSRKMQNLQDFCKPRLDSIFRLRLQNILNYLFLKISAFPEKAVDAFIALSQYEELNLTRNDAFKLFIRHRLLGLLLFCETKLRKKDCKDSRRLEISGGLNRIINIIDSNDLTLNCQKICDILGLCTTSRSSRLVDSCYQAFECFVRCLDESLLCCIRSRIAIYVLSLNSDSSASQTIFNLIFPPHTEKLDDLILLPSEGYVGRLQTQFDEKRHHKSTTVVGRVNLILNGIKSQHSVVCEYSLTQFLEEVRKQESCEILLCKSHRGLASLITKELLIGMERHNNDNIRRMFARCLGIVGLVDSSLLDSTCEKSIKAREMSINGDSFKHDLILNLVDYYFSASETKFQNLAAFTLQELLRWVGIAFDKNTQKVKDHVLWSRFLPNIRSVCLPLLSSTYCIVWNPVDDSFDFPLFSDNCSKTSDWIRKWTCFLATKITSYDVRRLVDIIMPMLLNSDDLILFFLNYLHNAAIKDSPKSVGDATICEFGVILKSNCEPSLFSVLVGLYNSMCAARTNEFAHVIQECCSLKSLSLAAKRCGLYYQSLQYIERFVTPQNVFSLKVDDLLLLYDIFYSLGDQDDVELIRDVLNFRRMSSHVLSTVESLSIWTNPELTEPLWTRSMSDLFDDAVNKNMNSFCERRDHIFVELANKVDVYGSKSNIFVNNKLLVDRLHVINDIERLTYSKNYRNFNKDIISSRVVESLLSLRRHISGIIDDEQKPSVILQMTRFLRREGRFDEALTCLQTLSEWTLSSVYEKAKIFKAIYQTDRGRLMKILQDSLTFCKSLTDSSEIKRQLEGKLYLMWAQCSAESSSSPVEEIIEAFGTVIRLRPINEKAYFQLAKYYDRLSCEGNIEDLKSGHCNEAIVMFATSLRYGSKFIHESMQRLIFLWLKAPDPPNNKLATLFNSFPTYYFMAVLSQLTCRICHANNEIFKILSNILVKLLQSYPQQTLWGMIAISKSSIPMRVERCRQIFSLVRGDKSLGKLIDDFAKLADELILVSNRRLSKSSSLKDNFRSLLHLFDKSRSMSQIMLPFQSQMTPNIPEGPLHMFDVFPSEQIHIIGFNDLIEVLPSLQKPKKLSLLCSDGITRFIMCKPKDDLRKDSRMMEFFTVVNSFLRNNSETRQRNLSIRTYSVIPLNEECGLIEWVNNTCSFRSILSDIYKDRGMFVSPKILRQVAPSIGDSIEQKMSVFRDKLLAWHPPVFSDWFLSNFEDAPHWFKARQNYIRSCAVMSIVGYIVGLGDRHGENIMMEGKTGQCIHVDFNCLFNLGDRFEWPEVVPFRLTHNMIEAMGVCGTEGTFRTTCQLVMEILSRNSTSLLNVLSSFMYDPLVEWNHKPKKSKTRNSEEFNELALQHIDAVERRLGGFFDNKYNLLSQTLPLSADGHVNLLIREATDVKNLAQMFIGWAAFL